METSVKARRHIDHPHEDTYLQAIVESTGTLARPVKVAVDCGNAVPGPAMTKLLDMIGQNTLISTATGTTPDRPRC